MADLIGVAGLAISGVSLFFQLYAGTVQGIQLMLVAKDVPEKYRTIHFRLKIEQGKFLSWGYIFGLVQEETDQGEPLRISIPDQVRYMVQGHVEPLWQQVLQFTTETPSFDGQGRQHTLRQSLSYGDDHVGRRFCLNRLYDKGRLGGVRLKDRLNWAYLEMKKLEDLVECMRHVNNSVIALTEVKTQQEINETVKATFMGLLSLQSTVDGLKELITALDVNRHNHGSSRPVDGLGEPEDLLRNLAQLKELRVQSENDEGNDNRPSDYTKDGLKFDIDRVRPHRPKYESRQRLEALVDNEPGYWVEYKQYPRVKDIPGPTKDEIERHIVRELATLLKLKLPKSFRVARCVGYYDDLTSFGLLFEKNKTQTNLSMIPLSFDLRLKDHYPSLGDRIILARAVTETVYQLHVVGWLHKALRAENILFFERGDGSVAYGEPYISGFEYARPASQPNMTQEADSGSTNDDFYRHPDIQICNPRHRDCRYSKEYDLYSLGILLIEIALWKPISETLMNTSPSNTRSFILSDGEGCLRRVSFAVGIAYAEVVRVCLRGFGIAEESAGEANTYINSFEKLIVKTLRSITVNK